MTIDWTELATSVGSLRADGSENGGDQLARDALARIVGDAVWRDAVEHYVANRRGSELARSVMWLVRPPAAIERCRELITTSADEDMRANAAELLRVVGDARIVPWIAAFLADRNERVQSYAAGMVDQLLWSSIVGPESCTELLAMMRSHANERVRERAVFIDSFIADRVRPS